MPGAAGGDDGGGLHLDRQGINYGEHNSYLFLHPDSSTKNMGLDSGRWCSEHRGMMIIALASLLLIAYFFYPFMDGIILGTVFAYVGKPITSSVPPPARGPTSNDPPSASARRRKEPRPTPSRDGGPDGSPTPSSATQISNRSSPTVRTSTAHEVAR